MPGFTSKVHVKGETMIFIFILLAFFSALFIGSVYTIKALNRVKLKSSLKKNIKTGSKENILLTLLKLIEKDPYDVRTRLQAARLYMELSSYKEAALHLNIVLTHGQEDPELNEKEINRMLAECYLKLKNFNEAYKIFTVLKTLDPEDTFPYIQIARIEKQRGEKANATKHLEKALSLQPDNIDILKEMSTLLYETKKYNEALVILKRAMESNPNDPEINYYLAEIKYKYQNPKEALQHYIKSRSDPRFKIKSLFMIGKIFRHYNKLDEARKVFAAALQMSGLKRDQMLALQYELAEVCLLQNDIQNAIQLWESILSQASKYKDVRTKLDKYEQTRSNYALRAYMMSTKADFLKLCKKMTLKFADNVTILRTESQMYSTVEIFAQVIQNKVPTIILFKFFRGTNTIGQLAVREFYEKTKEVKAKQGICFTNTDFTEDSFSFCEGRVLELLGKKELLKYLTRAVS